MDEQTRDNISRAIENNDILLFMKGTRQAPQCGFSARTVEILDSLVDEYATVDVLAHPEVREGIKEWSSWPTIPQLYVQGEFVGGCDIVTEMFESGELQKKLGVDAGEVTPPSIIITDRAAETFRGVVTSSDEIVCLEIDRAFQPGLTVGPVPPRAILVESNGIRIALDRLSAGRANGLKIDYIDTPEGAAFKIDNPNEPAKVEPLSVTELKEKLDANEDFVLVDVRTPGERATASIEGARLLDQDAIEELMSLPKETELVFHCHHGHRSQRAAQQFLEAGFTKVYNVVGGIDAWSEQVDPSVPRY